LTAIFIRVAASIVASFIIVAVVNVFLLPSHAGKPTKPTGVGSDALRQTHLDSEFKSSPGSLKISDTSTLLKLEGGGNKEVREERNEAGTSKQKQKEQKKTEGRYEEGAGWIGPGLNNNNTEDEMKRLMDAVQNALSETDQKAFWQHSSATSLTDLDNEIAEKEKAINLVQSDFDAKVSQKLREYGQANFLAHFSMRLLEEKKEATSAIHSELEWMILVKTAAMKNSGKQWSSETHLVTYTESKRARAREEEKERASERARERERESEREHARERASAQEYYREMLQSRERERERERETSTPLKSQLEVVGASRDEALKKLISKSKRDGNDMEEDQTDRHTDRQSENISVGEEELDWKRAQREFVSGGRGEEEKS
jgi:hypothetical protein